MPERYKCDVCGEEFSPPLGTLNLSLNDQLETWHAIHVDKCGHGDPAAVTFSFEKIPEASA